MRVRTSVAAMFGFAVVSLCIAASFNGAAAADTWGACCLAHGSCLDGYNSTSCSNVGGSYNGDGTECSSVACEPVPCGESGSPVCGGTCPAGTRCIDTENLQVLIVVSVLSSTEEGKTPTSCQCVDVRCGGAPLENGQGCCAGTPFTIGAQGCCNGEVVPVDSPCICGDGNSNQLQAVGAPTDLRTTGCCATTTLLPTAIDSSTESGVLETTFNIVEGGCCQRQTEIDNALQDPFVGSYSTYTFGTGLDCCPGGPIDVPPGPILDIAQVLDLAGLCVGACFDGECAAQDCCQCEANCGPDVEGTCVGAGSQSSCESFCSTLGCENETYAANAMCTEDGSCGAAAAAPAPAVSPTGLVALLVVLVAIGGFAILGRRARTS